MERETERNSCKGTQGKRKKPDQVNINNEHVVEQEQAAESSNHTQDNLDRCKDSGFAERSLSDCIYLDRCKDYLGISRGNKWYNKEQSYLRIHGAKSEVLQYGLWVT